MRCVPRRPHRVDAIELSCDEAPGSGSVTLTLQRPPPSRRSSGRIGPWQPGAQWFPRRLPFQKNPTNRGTFRGLPAQAGRHGRDQRTRATGTDAPPRTTVRVGRPGSARTGRQRPPWTRAGRGASPRSQPPWASAPCTMGEEPVPRGPGPGVTDGDVRAPQPPAGWPHPRNDGGHSPPPIPWPRGWSGRKPTPGH
jgi:hypothetical protein